MCLVFPRRAVDRYMGLKLKCGTKGSAGDRGTKPVTVPSRGGSSSSDSRRQTDQGARRAMSPEYGDEPGPLGETRTPDCVQPCWGCSSELRPCRSSRIRGVHSATSCRAFQIKALLFLRVLFFIFFFFFIALKLDKLFKCLLCVFLFSQI